MWHGRQVSMASLRPPKPRYLATYFLGLQGRPVNMSVGCGVLLERRTFLGVLQWDNLLCQPKSAVYHNVYRFVLPPQDGVCKDVPRAVINEFPMPASGVFWRMGLRRPYARLAEVRAIYLRRKQLLRRCQCLIVFTSWTTAFDARILWT